MFPRSGPLATAGGLIFFSTGSDRRFRAYDRDNGKELWSTELPTTSDGMPATYQVNGRQFVVVPVAAGAGSVRASLRWTAAGRGSWRRPAGGSWRRPRSRGGGAAGWRAEPAAWRAAGALAARRQRGLARYMVFAAQADRGPT